MSAKIIAIFTRSVNALGVANLSSIRDTVALKALDPAKSSEYAWSALQEALYGDAGPAPALAKITVTIESADAAADVAFPEMR